MNLTPFSLFQRPEQQPDHDHRRRRLPGTQVAGFTVSFISYKIVWLLACISFLEGDCILKVESQQTEFDTFLSIAFRFEKGQIIYSW